MIHVPNDQEVFHFSNDVVIDGDNPTAPVGVDIPGGWAEYKIVILPTKPLADDGANAIVVNTVYKVEWGVGAAGLLETIVSNGEFEAFVTGPAAAELPPLMPSLGIALPGMGSVRVTLKCGDVPALAGQSQRFKIGAYPGSPRWYPVPLFLNDARRTILPAFCRFLTYTPPAGGLGDTFIFTGPAGFTLTTEAQQQDFGGFPVALRVAVPVEATHVIVAPINNVGGCVAECWG